MISAPRRRQNGEMPRLATGPLAARWSVVALCAEWCGTCRDYFTAFAQHAERRVDARHLWIDIEDDSDWLGDVDVETLPSLLVLQDGQPMFFGPVLPNIDVLERTLRALMQDGPNSRPIAPEHRATVEHIVAQLLQQQHVRTAKAP